MVVNIQEMYVAKERNGEIIAESEASSSQYHFNQMYDD